MKTSMRKTTLAVLGFTLALPLAAAPRRAATPPVWPPCASVTGSPAVTFSRDGGQTFVPVEQKLEGIGYTAVAALNASALVSRHKGVFSLSIDAGCTWRPAGTLDVDSIPVIVAGPRTAWTYLDNRPSLARFDLATQQLTTVKAPGSIIGLAVDSNNDDHVTVGTAEADIFDSVDGGATWTRVGIVPATIPILYRVAFDPNVPRHMVAGMATDGVLVTQDGGRNWTKAAGLGAKGQVNAFQVVISPADPNVVWAEALDMSDEASASHGRHIYRSSDGGLTFAAVVDGSPDVTLINGTTMAAHPTDPNVLCFVFGTFFQGYGTDVFRYDAAANHLQKSHLEVDDINAIAFSPADPNVMYFGLEVERGVH
jgi:hypothetical protein